MGADAARARRARRRDGGHVAALEPLAAPGELRPPPPAPAGSAAFDKEVQAVYAISRSLTVEQKRIAAALGGRAGKRHAARPLEPDRAEAAGRGTGRLRRWGHRAACSRRSTPRRPTRSSRAGRRSFAYWPAAAGDGGARALSTRAWLSAASPRRPSPSYPLGPRGRRRARRRRCSRRPGGRRTWTFAQAAEEAALSRIYGGIHFPMDGAAGLELGPPGRARGGSDGPNPRRNRQATAAGEPVLQVEMLEFSRALYRDLAPDVDPGLPGGASPRARRLRAVHAAPRHRPSLFRRSGAQALPRHPLVLPGCRSRTRVHHTVRAVVARRSRRSRRAAPPRRGRDADALPRDDPPLRPLPARPSATYGSSARRTATSRSPVIRRQRARQSAARRSAASSTSASGIASDRRAQPAPRAPKPSPGATATRGSVSRRSAVSPSGSRHQA